jgi:predicted dehydrogenase
MRRRTLSRRVLLKSAAALFAAPFVVPRHILGGPGHVAANDRVQIGVIGIGARGKYLITNLPPAGRITALCDCFLDRVQSAREPSGDFAQPLTRFRDEDAAACSVHQDYRRMFDDAAIDAAIICPPDHHHVLAAVLACQAGKDVYIEKPLTLTIAEGRTLVETARRTGRVVQVGSQQRTMEVNRRGCEFVRTGGLGKISLVEVRNLPGPMPAPDFPEQPVPRGMDWDLFCGPAPLRAHHRDLWDKDAYKFGYLTWRGWDLFRDFSGHLMTNWGGHSIDMVQLALGTDDTGPVEIVPRLDRLFADEGELDRTLDDQWHDKTPPLGTVADRRVDALRFCPVSLKYASGVEVRLVSGLDDEVFHGERGRLIMSRNKARTDPPDLARFDDNPAESARWKGDGNVARPHLENWLECLRTRGVPNAPLEAGHRTATICHLVNIARELARPLRWDPQAERFVGDDQANQLLDRPRRKGFELPTLS